MFNSVLGTVFHIDGASRNVDAQLGLPADPGSQVVQGETGGYVVGGNRIIEFGKSDLAVGKVTAPAAQERPVALEIAGGPYLVYRQAGQIVRLGDEHTPPLRRAAGSAIRWPPARARCGSTTKGPMRSASWRVTRTGSSAR